MSPSFAKYQKRNPLRAADWRWERARSLHAVGSRYSRRSDDEATGRALKYHRERVRCQTERQLQRLARRHPALDAAFQLWLQGGDARAVLEARLLTGQNADEIAAASGLSVDTVTTFEQTFFDVTDRLAARSWVRLAVLGSPDPSGSPVDRVHRLVRRLAYYGGPLMLELVLRALQPLDQAPRLLAGDRDGGDECELDGLTRRLRVLFLAEGLRMADSRAVRTPDSSAHTPVSHLADWDQILAPHVASALDLLLESEPDLCDSEGEAAGSGTQARHATQVA